jgi:exopolyphosphatase/guanosine-5'-triphosphate,3'-diphosphate pyrophosphatase
VSPQQPTLLGEHLRNDGRISEDGMARAAEAVGRAVRVGAQQDVDQMYTFVTSAVRDAVNRDEVIDRTRPSASTGTARGV